MIFLPAEIIKKTRNRVALEKAEIEFLVDEYTHGRLPDYQMAAWMMAVCLNGISDAEIHLLTQAVLHSGQIVRFAQGSCVDKHSTGGVGDKTSLIVGPIVAALGLKVPMIAGRSLGHTGGTVDKLESIPGFSTQLSLTEFQSQVDRLGLCMIGQSREICPADRLMYALRDVTATIESVALISASIMSKKMAEGIHGLMMDIKLGSGAFMKSRAQGLQLAEQLIAIGRTSGLKVSCYLTSMDQPLGQMVGNSLEVEECLSILRGEPAAQKEYADTRRLSVELAAEMIRLGGLEKDSAKARALATTCLQSGKAYEKFIEMCVAQGGRVEELPRAQHSAVITAEQAGFIDRYDTEQVGIAGILLGAGRRQVRDKIDAVAGLRVHQKIGDAVAVGEPLYTLYGSDSSKFAEAERVLRSAISISLQKPQSPSLIQEQVVFDAQASHSL